MASTTQSTSATYQASTQVNAGDGNSRLQALFNLFKQHPVMSALLIWTVDLIINVGVSLGATAWLPTFQPDFVALCVIAAVTAGAIGALGWWRTIGFNRPSEWQHLRVLILPAIAMIAFPFAAGLKMLDAGTTLYFILAYALVAFHEEAVNRGIILHVLRPVGLGKSVMIGALLFGSAHLANLLVRANPAIVFAQAFGAFTEGIGFGIIRFRTNTLWGLIGLHFLEDLLLHYGFLPVPLVNAAQHTVTLGVGIYIYWKYRQEKKAAREEATNSAAPAMA